MTIVKLIREVYDNSGNVSSRKAINTVLTAEVHKDSERAVDSATFEFPMQNAIKENDGLLYVQDIVDTRYLTGIWDFHYSIKDESGNALDGTCANEAVTLYDNITLDKFANTVYRKVASSGDHISVTDSSNLVDFSGQFDIYCWFSTGDTGVNTKYILDKEDGVTGIFIRITSGTSGTVVCDFNNGAFTINGTKIVNDNTWHLLRLVRNSANDIKLYIDGQQDGSTVNTSTSFKNNAATLTFGTNPNAVPTSSRLLLGKLLQIRIYCGGILSDSDASTVFSYMPQPYTMKFGGIVTQIEDGTDSKKVFCKSFGKILSDVQATFNNLTTQSGDYNTTLTNYINHNVYVGKTIGNIITDLVSNLLSGWTLMFVPSAGNILTKYVASGSFLANMFYLIYTQSDVFTFFSTARKTLIVESVGQDHTVTPSAIAFKGVQLGGRYDISDDGKDDQSYINDVQVTGAIATAVDHKTATTSDGNKAVVLNFYPISAQVQQPNGTYLPMDSSPTPAAGKYYIDTENKRIVFGTAFAASTCTIDYTYEDTINLYFRGSDATGITKNGRYSKAFNIPQYKDYIQLAAFVNNIMSRFGNNTTHTIPQRVKIIAPNLVNNIRENFKVSVTSGVKGIVDTAYTIKQIVYYYPQVRTEIHLGDFLYDMYDINSAGTNATDQNIDSYSKTKNV